MSTQTRKEVLNKMRSRYGRAGKKHKSQLLTQVIELFGYHRKAAIRALRSPTRFVRPSARPVGRPRQYLAQELTPVLKPIWFAAGQPCSVRLRALLPEWLPAYEVDHKRLNADVRQSLLQASARTLDRLLAPLRVSLDRRGGTKPGSLLRQQIPIRGEWTEDGPGWLEVDTVALCGGSLDDRHAWMLDGVCVVSHWVELRALQSRSQHCTLEQLQDVERTLPFALLGVDSDNGGEFLNHHLLRYLQERRQPVVFTRSRPYRKNDNAHVEQRNWTHVRQHFGYERYDNPEVVPLLNRLCRGALGQMLNHFLPTQKLVEKKRQGSRITRGYGPVLTPYQRLMQSEKIEQTKKAQLRQLHEQLNPFQLHRDIEAAKREIERHRRVGEPE